MKEEISKALLNFNPAFSEDELEFGLSFFEEKEFKASSLICKAARTDFVDETRTNFCHRIQKFRSSKSISIFAAILRRYARVDAFEKRFLTSAPSIEKLGFVWGLPHRASTHYANRRFCESAC